VLRSGNHGAIALWRAQEQRRRTRQRRPDLWRRWQARQALERGDGVEREADRFRDPPGEETPERHPET
jgi:tRNA G37 N-methylase TrmD